MDDDDQNGENDIIIFVDDGYQDDGEPVPEPTDDKPAEDEDTGKEVSSTERVVRSRSVSFISFGILTLTNPLSARRGG